MRAPPLLLCLLCAAWLAATGCRQSHAPAPEDTPYAREIGDICSGEERSGALSRPEAERPIVLAEWLGTRIRSDQARAFLARVSRAAPADKAAILRAEAARVGLDGCPLAGSWGGAPASPP